METQYNSADYYGFKANLLRGSSVPSSRERWESRLSPVSGVACRLVGCDRVNVQFGLLNGICQNRRRRWFCLEGAAQVTGETDC